MPPGRKIPRRRRDQGAQIGARGPHRLAELIRARRGDVLAAWEDAVRHLPRARALDRPTLLDSIPGLLDRIAEMAEAIAAGEPPRPPTDAAESHALERLAEGFDLEQVVAEYAVLRGCLVGLCSNRASVRVVNQAIDHAVAASVQRYTRARDRTLQSLDRISAAALETRSLEDFLERLLHVLLEATQAVDIAVIMLRDGDVLRVRASAGVNKDATAGWSLRIGEGLAGLIAATRRPHAVRSAATDPLVLNPSLRGSQVRGLFGVPLIEGGDVIGVALMGSLTAHELSRQDQRLFEAMARRATSAIALRRSEAERARALEQAQARQAELAVEVTERKRIELALRERELMFRSIADNIPQQAWMADETGAIVWYNRRWYEFAGKTFAELRGWGWQALHHPDHFARVMEKLRRHVASGEPWEDTFPLRAADGRYRWFLSRAVPIRDEHGQVVRWFGTNTDVSEQRFMHEAMTLLSSSLEYRATLAQLAQLAVPALGDWCIVDVVEEAGVARVAVAHAEPAKAELARELLRQPPPALGAAARIPHVIRTGRTEYVPEVSDEILAGLACDPEHVRIARELGIKSYVIAPLIARDRTLGAISFVSAESGRRYTPADLDLIEEIGRRAGLAIDNARLFGEAQREARMREEILAVVSHDLRNPLGAIHLAATMLLERPELATRKHVETIHRAAGRMDHLIGDLLDMASIQAGRLSIARKPEDADALVREVLESHEPMAKEKGLTLVRAGDLRGVRIAADKNRILQVFGNLIGNAIKFCRPGDTITLRGERRGAEAELAVANTGPAISEADQPHIFEPYWSAKKYTKQGVGLGLYISKGIVEAHGGRIRVESKLGEGTTFFFTIPLA